MKRDKMVEAWDGSQKREYEFKTYKYQIDFQNCKINYQSRIEMPTLVSSILDEEIFKNHVSIFDDIKIQSSLILLSHGQILTIYNIVKKHWLHFFNRETISRSNKQTKLICLKQFADKEEEEFEDYALRV